MRVRAFVGLGANLGDAEAALHAAVAGLAELAGTSVVVSVVVLPSTGLRRRRRRFLEGSALGVA